MKTVQQFVIPPFVNRKGNTKDQHTDLRLILSIAISIFCFVSNAQIWNQMSDFPGTARDDASTFKIGEKVYCGLGLDAGFSCTSDFKIFDLTTETWSNGVSLPSGEERQYANGFSHQGFGYIFGGINCSAAYLADFWKFNPATNSWTSLPDLPALGRAGSLSFVIQDTFYVVGGKTNGGSITSEVWAFNLINQQWSQKTNLPIDGIWRGVSFSWNATGIIGLGKLNDGTLNTACYNYFPVTDAWLLIPQLNLVPSTYSMFSQLGNKGFIYGGMLEDLSYSNQFLRIDLDTWETTSLTAFPADARRGGVGFVGNNDFYISMGVSALARLNETWKASSVLGIEEEKMMKLVSIYPNPVKNKLSIHAAFPVKTIELYTISGNLIEQVTMNSMHIELPLQLENGYYFVKVTSETTEVVESICVHN